MDDSVRLLIVWKLSSNTGKKHNLLVMDIKFIVGKKVAPTVPHHIGEVLEDFGENLNVNTVNPETLQIFTITNEVIYLDDKKKESHNLITANSLWIMKLSRPDLESAVSFLCTRVQYPTKGYWGKLRRVLKYLKATKYDQRITASDNLLKLETRIDASHTAHEDMMVHTGG